MSPEFMRIGIHSTPQSYPSEAQESRKSRISVRTSCKSFGRSASVLLSVRKFQLNLDHIWPHALETDSWDLFSPTWIFFKQGGFASWGCIYMTCHWCTNIYIYIICIYLDITMMIHLVEWWWNDPFGMVEMSTLVGRSVVGDDWWTSWIGKSLEHVKHAKANHTAICCTSLSFTAYQ